MGFLKLNLYFTNKHKQVFVYVCINSACVCVCVWACVGISVCVSVYMRQITVKVAMYSPIEYFKIVKN